MEKCFVCNEIHPITVSCDQHRTESPRKYAPAVPFPADTPAAPVKLHKEHVRVVTELGHVFDMDKPEGFSMSQFMVNVKAAGEILNDFIYQPLDRIVTIFVWSDANPPKEIGNASILPFNKV